jgi:hypothetical protein
LHLFRFGHFYCLFQVQWVQQQHEKKRKKRDYVFRPSVTPFSQYFSAAAPGALPSHGHPRYRAAPVGEFPDPLFKEQWYLVSVVFSASSDEDL